MARAARHSRVPVWCGWDKDEVLFVSGTASIVGHATLHPADVVAQTRETLANIEAVLEQANQQASQPGFNLAGLYYKVYVRHAADLVPIRTELERTVGAVPHAIYLQADVCRQDLLVGNRGHCRTPVLHARQAGLTMRAALRVLLNAYDYLVLYLGLTWLGVVCLAWTPIAIIVYPLLSARRGQALGRYVIMAGFRLYLASLSMSRRCSFDLEALDALRDEPSLIIAPNHPCLLDAVMVISRLPNVACVLKADLMNNIFLGAECTAGALYPQ